MNVIFQPDSFVYYCSNKREILLYDSLHNRPYVISKKNQEIRIENDRLLFINPNEECLSQIKDISLNGLGYINYSSAKQRYFSVNDYRCRKETFQSLIEEEKYDVNVVKGYINKITIHLDSFYDLYSLKESKRLYQRPNMDLFFSFLKDISINNNCIIRFISGKVPLPEIEGAIKASKLKYTFELVVPFHSYNQLKKNKTKHLGNIEYILMCDDCFKQMNPEGLNRDMHYLFLIEDEDDISFLEKNGAFYEKLDVKILPVWSDRSNFLQKYLLFDENDILLTPLSVNQILKRELVNELYFGQISIQYDGDVYSNFDIKIGNIISMRDIKYVKLLDETSLWMQNRNKFSPCENCNYKNLCPPLSLIELLSNRTFCNVCNS